MGTDTPKITIVVPTYNERDNLPILVGAIADLRIPNVTILVVDDSSPDGTGEVAEKLAVDGAVPLSVMHRNVKDGLGRAYVAGITKALADGADIVIQMDADLSHPTSAIPVMLERLATTDAAVVLGSRYVSGGSVAGDWPWHRKALSAWANFYVNTILRLRVKDVTAGFKAWHAETLRTIRVETVRSNGYAFQVEMNYRVVQHNLKIDEVPIRFEQRIEGKSKMSLGVQIESALVPWKLLLGRESE